LSLARSVLQGDEDLGLSLFPKADGIADDAGAAGIAKLIAETVKEACGGMALLRWSGSILVEDAVDDGQERPQLGLGARDGVLVARWCGRREDSRECRPVEVVFPASGAFGEFPQKNAAADLSPVVHIGVHS